MTARWRPLPSNLIEGARLFSSARGDCLEAGVCLYVMIFINPYGIIEQINNVYEIEYLFLDIFKCYYSVT